MDDKDVIFVLKGDGYTMEALRGYFTDQYPTGDPSWIKDRDRDRKQLCHFIVTEGGIELAPRISLQLEFCRGKGKKLLELIADCIRRVSRYKHQPTDRPASQPVYQSGWQFVGREKRTLFVLKDGNPALDDKTIFCLNNHFYFLLPDVRWTRRLLNVIAKHLFLIFSFGDSREETTSAQ